MNKYQEAALGRIKFYLFTEDEKTIIDGAEAKFKDGKLILKQGDDITITKCALVMEENDNGFKNLKILFNINNKWVTPAKNFRDKTSALSMLIDFKEPFTSIKIEQTDGLIDPFELPVEFVMASVDEYNKRKAKEKALEEAAKQKELNEKIEPDFACGHNLINLYWNIVSANIKTIKINLYLCKNFKFKISHVSKHITDPITKQTIEKSFRETKIFQHGTYRQILSFTESGETCFKSITGLAFGDYAFEIIELDARGKIVAETDKIFLELCNYSR